MKSKKHNKNQRSSTNQNTSMNSRLEIDYTRLAEAIVQAQDVAKKEEKTRLMKKTRFRNTFLGFINGAIYHGIFAVCIVFIIGIWISFYQEQRMSVTLSIILTMLFAIVGGVSFLCGQETMDDDYETTVSLLNLNISLIAMVIAMISLLHSIK